MILKFSIFFFFLCADLSAQLNHSSATVDQNYIQISYPYEGMKLPNVSKTFVFGSVKNSSATFFINGEKINLYKNGGFIAYLPVSTGAFSFDCVAYDLISTYTYTRKVYVSQKNSIDFSTSSFYLTLLSPTQNMEVLTGDEIFISVISKPNKKLRYEIGDFKDKLIENSLNPGYYYGVYKVRQEDSGKDLKLEILIKNDFLHKDYMVVSSNIKVLKTPYVVKTSSDNVVLKNDLKGGYAMFLPKDIKLYSTGKIGDFNKISLDSLNLWVDESKIEKTGEIIKPHTETGNVVFTSSSNVITAKIALYDRVPYIAYVEENSMKLELYYTSLHTNWIIYNSSDTYTRDLQMKQLGQDRVLFTFNFKEKLWGYDINYSTNSLLIDFKFKPKYQGRMPKPLEGLRIVLDPGHSYKDAPPYDGAIGPSGYFEFQANLAIAKKLFNKLANLGATVYMTRYSDDKNENVPLALRPQIAKNFNGDIFISIHNNAISDGEDPFSKPRGFQIYYYHPQSMDLAIAMHNSFLKNISLPDEGLRYGDYLVLRQTYMPAILIENAYMILPEQEEMLKSNEGQEKFAEAIKMGIVDFFKENTEISPVSNAKSEDNPKNLSSKKTKDSKKK